MSSILEFQDVHEILDNQNRVNTRMEHLITESIWEGLLTGAPLTEDTFKTQQLKKRKQDQLQYLRDLMPSAEEGQIPKKLDRLKYRKTSLGRKTGANIVPSPTKAINPQLPTLAENQYTIAESGKDFFSGVDFI